jgi:hypothetical protein
VKLYSKENQSNSKSPQSVSKSIVWSPLSLPFCVGFPAIYLLAQENGKQKSCTKVLEEAAKAAGLDSISL